jgi:hypothetical protein
MACKALIRVYLNGVFVVSLNISFLGIAKAENSGTKLWPRIKIGNEVYADVVYVEHDASRVKFTHASGVANVPIEELPSSLQKDLGYDPSKAAANEVKLAAEQQAVRAQVQADIAKAREQSHASASSAGQPQEKDGMIRVIETEIIPPDEVQRLGISGLQKYRQPGESPLEQMDRERKTGVIKKVWKWVPKPEPEKQNTSAGVGRRKKERTLKVYGVTQFGSKGELTHIIKEDAEGTQKVYKATQFGGKGDLEQIVQNGKAYNTTQFGSKDRVAQIIEDGKIYNATQFGSKGEVAQIMEGNKIYTATQFGGKGQLSRIIEED